MIVEDFLDIFSIYLIIKNIWGGNFFEIEKINKVVYYICSCFKCCDFFCCIFLNKFYCIFEGGNCLFVGIKCKNGWWRDKNWF